MFLTNFFTIFFLIILNQSIDVQSLTNAIKKDWDYKFVSTEIINSNPDIVQASMKVTRISRGNYGLSGKVTLFKGEFGGNGYIEINTFRSPRNDGDYQPLPYKFPKTTFYKFMNEQYKNLIMDSIRGCSNLPIVEDEYKTSITEGTSFEMKDCVFQDNPATPSHLQPGFYKVEAKLARDENDVNITCVIIVEIMPAS